MVTMDLIHLLCLFYLSGGTFYYDIEQKILSGCDESNGTNTLVEIGGTNYTFQNRDTYLEAQFLLNKAYSENKEDKSLMILQLGPNIRETIEKMNDSIIGEVCIEVESTFMNTVTALCDKLQDFECTAIKPLKANTEKVKYCQNSTHITTYITNKKGTTVETNNSKSRFYYIKLNKLVKARLFQYTVKIKCPKRDEDDLVDEEDEDYHLDEDEILSIETVCRRQPSEIPPGNSNPSITSLQSKYIGEFYNKQNYDDFHLECKA